MVKRVFERDAKVGKDSRVRVSTTIYDHHLTGESDSPSVQVSISATVEGVQPSFTFYVDNEADLFAMAEQMQLAAWALVHAKYSVEQAD